MLFNKMNFLLRTQDQSNIVDPIQAKLYVAMHFRQNQFMRDPAEIDKMLNQGLEVLLDGTHLYSEDYHFKKYIMPENAVKNNEGFSFYEEAKFKNKSKLLKDFFKTDRPNN